MSWGKRRGEAGQASVIIIGFAMVVLLLVVVVIDASAAYLTRQQLDSLADGAALHGADQAAQGQEVYSGGLAEGDLDLSRPEAHDAVGAYLADVGARRDHPGLRWSVTVQDERVVVRISAPADLPLRFPGVDLDPTVTAAGSAVVRPDPG